MLLFYHERTSVPEYTLRVALLDDETGRVARGSCRSRSCDRSSRGSARGDVNDVVFVQGAVPLADGTIYLTYGAGDRCVGAASVDTAEVVGALLAAA